MSVIPFEGMAVQKKAVQAPQTAAERLVTPPPYEGMPLAGDPVSGPVVASENGSEINMYPKVIHFTSEQVLENFPPVNQVMRVLSHCEGEFSYTQLLAALLSGSMHLHKWENDGWAVVNIWNGWIDIICLHDPIKDRAANIFNFFQDMSKKYKFKGIRFTNLRRGAIKKALNVGFEVRLIECVRRNK